MQMDNQPPPLRRCLLGSEVVIDMGSRELVDGVLAAEVVRVEGLRIEGNEVLGTFAWVPVSDLQPVPVH